MSRPPIVIDVREGVRRNDLSQWQIALDPPVKECATLTARSEGGAVLVVEVLAIERDETGTFWLVTEKPLPIGTEVEVTLRG